MVTTFSPGLSAVIRSVYDRPSLTLMLPFEPKMASKSELSHIMKQAEKEAERQLSKDYGFEIVGMMIRKLQVVFEELNYATHEKSVAIFLSPIFQKVLYLNIAVNRKIIIDGAFSIRDVVRNRQEKVQYLALALNGSSCEVFHFDGRSCTRMVFDVPRSYEDIVNEWFGSASSFTDESTRRQVVMQEFLLRIDKSLAILLDAYALPVFVIGPGEVVGHFAKVTKNAEAIVRVIYHDSYITTNTLGDVVAPYLRTWKELMDKKRLQKMGAALTRRRLAAGIPDVWLAAKKNNIEQLIVEKNFYRFNGRTEKVFPIRMAIYDKYSETKDVVDDIVGRVLQHRGEVSMVDDGALEEYGQIVAIKRK